MVDYLGLESHPSISQGDPGKGYRGCTIPPEVLSREGHRSSWYYGN